MAPFPEEVAAAPVQAASEYSILKQRVDLDVDFAGQSLKGSTEITIQPLAKELKQIRLQCRQCKPTAIQAGGITAKWEYEDPYRRSRMPAKSDVHQHDMLKAKIETSLRPAPRPELIISLPPRLKIQELQTEAPLTTQQPSGTLSTQKQESDAVAETPTVQSAAQQGPQFAPIKLFIEFEVTNFRDGLHWIGHADGDRRFPYVYTRAKPWPGNSSCIFPCVDDSTSRCGWEISIRCPRTLGDAFRMYKETNELPNGHGEDSATTDAEMVNGVDALTESNNEAVAEYLIDISEEEAALDLAIVCTGDVVDDVTDSEDDSRHTVTFNIMQPVTARHIGFAVGPFEHVNLSATRGSEEEERLGPSAIKVDGYCLPGKSADVQNTCHPIAWAIDNMGVKYGSFPFSSFQMVFVDDFVYETVAIAGLSFCSSGLLFPKTVIEPLYRNTRILVRTLADQWMGVNVIAHEPTDEWVVAGIAGFMTDLYMKELSGNNEFRWQQRLAAEKVYDLDVDRPSLQSQGELLHLDPSIRDFVNVKSALVLFILNQRLMKVSGQTGVHRIINRILLSAKTGALVNGEISTEDFQRTCERLGHNKLESFFRQWVAGSGVPIFYVTQRFNKKKLCVEMSIVQKQLERVTKPPFEPSNFMREIKEHVGEIWAPETNPVFTGPMTIRIHEADGTPYETIIEMKEAVTKFEIPYNTKYKRLKRSRRQKERQIADGAEGEGGNDSLLYCLGDILDSEEEKRDWNLVDWTQEDEEKMGQESYEWIRMDADFEWIGKIHLVMPLYMYISQLQQDRDIVAQYESMLYLLASNPHHVSLSILVRTLMDSRYFWGIRSMAAKGIATCAKDKWREVGQFHLMKAFREMFCIGDMNMPKSNDFSDRRNFVLQCAIPKAMAQLRDGDDKVPLPIRQFFVDLLKFNDNSNNKIDDGDQDSVTFSDSHYIATLMSCLADSLVASHREPQQNYSFHFGEEEPDDPEDSNPDADFEQVAVAQIERHRRIDEWDPSYQNLYSTTALECLQRLTKASIVKDKTPELMRYVRNGNADNVRIAAWRCLSEIGFLRKIVSMNYLLKCLADDPSPRFRDGLLRVFGEALGHLAFGDPEPVKAPPLLAADSELVVEQEVSSETRRLEATRKTTPEGALVALKIALLNDKVFKDSLWYAATSPDTALDESAALCDIAALIYDPINALTVSMKLPKMWRCLNVGQGKVKFTTHGPYRAGPIVGLRLNDWQRLQELGLKYNGPLSAEVNEVLKKQKDMQTQERLKLQISRTEAQLAQAQDSALTPSGMAPPPVTPSIEKTGIRISLGGKRKSSVDLSAKASSPKAQKQSRQQTPSGRTASPRDKGSPASSQRRSATPGSRASVGRSTAQKRVILNLGSNARRAQELLASPPQPGRGSTPSRQQASIQPARSITPVMPQPSAFSPGIAQSPTNNPNYFGGSPFPADPSQTMNLGSFRSYPPPDAGEASPGNKRESIEDDAMTVHTSGTNGDAAPEHDTSQVMPPPPRPKLIIKFGSKASSQSSPE